MCPFCFSLEFVIVLEDMVPHLVVPIPSCHGFGSSLVSSLVLCCIAHLGVKHSLMSSYDDIYISSV